MALDYVPYDGPVVTRSEARALGLKRYFTGKPCKRGHLSERLVSGLCCLTCQSMLVKRWQDKNPGWYKNYPSHQPESLSAANKKHHAKHRERRNEENRLWRLENAEKYAATRSEWQKANRAKCNAAYHVYRARKNSGGGSHTPEQIEALNKRQKFKCANCGTSTKTKFHADHIMPVTKLGSSDISNIQILCPACNIRKGSRHPIDWAQQNGRLL